MKAASGFAPALALSILCIVLAPATSIAQGSEERVGDSFNQDLMISRGEYRAFIVHLAVGDKMMVTVQVGSESEIDLYTMTMRDFEDYKSTVSENFGYFPSFSKEMMKYLEYPRPFSPDVEDDYVILLDNAPKTATGAPGTADAFCRLTIKVEHRTPFPWALVLGVIILIVVVVAVAVVAVSYRRRLAAIREAEEIRKRAEAAKVRPIYIQPQAPGAEGVPLTAPPPSSTCKSCPHIYDPTSPNCIACEYR
ncbi:MAG: hypothetical protein QXH42_09945 [Thermoplasmata archaeon]